MKIITVANRKGGAGKSTCAAHLAIESIKAGLKTILIDLDPQKTLENWWTKRADDNPHLIDSSPNDITGIIESLKSKSFDLCIIDTPGDTSINATAGIAAADLVFIPTKPTSPDLSAIGRTISMVSEQKKPFVFVITQAISRTHAALQAASVLSEFGPVAPSSISNRIAYSNAMSSGISATEIDKTAAEELSQIWGYVAEKVGFQENKKEKAKVA